VATSLWRDSAAGIKLVAQDPTLRRLLAYAVLGAVAVAAPESLAIPLVHSLKGGSVEAGILTASIPAGFIVGSFAILRLPADRRPALLPWLVLLAVVPLLLTPLLNSIPALVALWAVSGLGSALQLIASAAYVSAAPVSARARAYGVATTALMAGQGAAQLGAGGIASAVGREGPGVAVAVLALVTLGCLPFLAGFVRSGRGISQGTREFVR
jgi:MFS family permease